MIRGTGARPARPAQRASRRPLRRLLLVAFVSAGCATTPWQGTPLDPATRSFAPELEVDLAEYRQTESGLYLQDLSEGAGPVARRNSFVSIHYAVWLTDGTLVDTSVGGSPFNVRLGDREVIKGWNEGIPGMKVGGRRRLVVRPGLAYGSRGSARVPPDATLVFEVQLVDVR